MKNTKEARNAVLSVVFGDGYVSKDGAVKLTHCEKQLDFLQWKREYLLSYGICCGEIVHFDNNGYPGVKMVCRATRWTKLLRKILYKNGNRKQVFTRKILNRLTPKHIAIWYMDDGGLSQKKRNGTVVANELMLNTHTTKENNQTIIDYFKELHGISFTQVKNKGHYRLRCGTKEARKFLILVKEWVEQVPSMAHKLNIKAEYRV